MLTLDSPEIHTLGFVLRALFTATVSLIIINKLNWPITSFFSCLYVLYLGTILCARSVSIKNRIISFSWFLLTIVAMMPICRIILQVGIDIKICIILASVLAAWIRNYYKIYVYSSTFSLIMFINFLYQPEVFIPIDNLLNNMFAALVSGAIYLSCISNQESNQLVIYQATDKNNLDVLNKLDQIINLNLKNRQAVIETKILLSKIKNRWKKRSEKIQSQSKILLESEDFQKWFKYSNNYCKIVGYLEKACIAYLGTKQMVEYADQKKQQVMEKIQEKSKKALKIVIKNILTRTNLININDIVKEIDQITEKINTNIIYEFIISIESAAYLSNKMEREFC